MFSFETLGDNLIIIKDSLVGQEFLTGVTY